MVQLIITPDQARIMAAATGQIEVRDEAGRFVGRISVDEFDDLEAIKRAAASDQPRYTTQQVLDYLDSLPEE